MVLGGSSAPAAVELAIALTNLFGVPGVVVRNAPVGGLHPGRSAEIRVERVGSDGSVEETVIGTVGEIDPAVAERYGVDERVGYVSFTLGGVEPWHGDAGLLSAERSGGGYRSISRMPSSDVDLAFVVPDEVPADRVLATLRTAGGELVAWAELFDVFRGASVPDGSRSLAFRIRCQASDRTLNEAELAELRTRMIAAVTSGHNAALRG